MSTKPIFKSPQATRVGIVMMGIVVSAGMFVGWLTNNRGPVAARAGDVKITNKN